METQEFIVEFLNRKRGQITRQAKIENEIGISSTWKFRYALAEATSTIDYDCGFDKRGICKTRQDNNRGLSKKELDLKAKDSWHPTMCCCSECHRKLGYLDTIPNDMKNIKAIARHFDDKKKIGFWRKGKGCALPRKYRSSICLIFCCGGGSMAKNDAFLMQLVSEEHHGEKIKDLRKIVYSMWAPYYRPNVKIRVASTRKVVDTVFDKFVKGKLEEELHLTGKWR